MNLDSIFYPKSIAVIGASTQEGSVGNDIVKNLASQGYTGKIFPINPKATELYGLKCYANIKDIEEKIDLAIVTVPAAIVPQVMTEAAKKKIKGAIVISAGFKEAGNVELENELAKICEKNNIALIGPNCLGVINPENKMNASFAMIMPNQGPVAFLSQSGALCTAVIDYAQKLGVGFSKFISVGNKAMIDEAHFFEYLYKDPATKIIAVYAEQLTHPQTIIATVKKLSRGKKAKPILIIKSGRTLAGASASASHTGALAGSDTAYDALFAQSGIVRVNSVSEMFEYLRVFAHNPLPTGRKTAIVTNAGGPGVLTTDATIYNGLELAKLSPTSEKALKKILPSFAGLHNPVDILGDAKSDRYRATLEILAKDKNVNNIVVILTPQSMTDIEAVAQVVIDIKNKTKKPIIASFMGGKMVSRAVQIMQQAGVATTGFPEQAAEALAALAIFAESSREKEAGEFTIKNINKKTAEKIFFQIKHQNKKNITEAAATEILEAYGFTLPTHAIATTADEALSVAKKINKKMVMKIISEDIIHKSDVGGVMLNITAENVKDKFEEMIKTIRTKKPAAKIDGVLLVEMAEKNGLEMILGSKKDPNLGNMIMVGLGGVYVEVFKDVAFGLSPITKRDAEKMLDRIKTKKILNGTRGQAALDTKALIDCLGRLSKLLTDFPEIKELDINPLLVLPKGHGVKVLDARMIME